jgi:hypothetical protein
VAPVARRRQISEERRILRAGIKGKQEAAYLLDFHFKASRNTAIIHDLRLEVNGRGRRLTNCCFIGRSTSSS